MRRGIANQAFSTILTAADTSALMRKMDATPMPSEVLGRPPVSDQLYNGYSSIDKVPPDLYDVYDVKRGLRNKDGSGVLVGLTTISNVHGYRKVDGRAVPDEGDLFIRGYSINELVEGAHSEDRFGYEELSYLLISGKLPTQPQLDDFEERIGERRSLPVGYLDIFPRATASNSIMNVLQRASLLLYAFDDHPDDTSPEHEVDVALSLLGRLPRIAAIAHSANQAREDNRRLIVPPVRDGYSMAETILDVLRGADGFSREEALLLDVMLMLHAEHGGGNNSTFACRVLSSSGTDAYSTYAAAMGSLKGPKHGGANERVGAMVEDIAQHVSHWDDDAELEDYLAKIAHRQAFDRSGLIYGIGHAVYTLSDPRAQIIKRYASKIAKDKGCYDRFALIESIERIAPDVVRDARGVDKPLCANIDLYSGFVYSMLGIPSDLHTPIFAIARMSGWVAHRMEELYSSGRINRPAYNSYLVEHPSYEPIESRVAAIGAQQE
ncbi:MAG: citrate synthase [Atopobiaceae bacterium]|jgi:citrate synthase|nr:citrate synthase [Atopobiaceae bacterium]MCH4120307.1 citrate synthase [Atopobiaceae bacterium]MCI1318375.1 citrate synthase [Atopobiaceae bacterium]MCI1389274.1 citrate synthase [Atopobiaceae bacterium]MCI1432337.1 citrate synthase [Atopobiaceae bacterium]